MSNNPTLVAASLDDKQLKDSISNLVAHMKRALHTMTKDTDDAVAQIQKSVQKLGQTEIKTSDGGVSKQKKAQDDYVESVKRSTTEVKRQGKEQEMTFDQIAAAQQKAANGSRMGVLETYNMQIELMKNRLREVRQDIDIFNAAIGSGKKTQIEWGQQGLKQANAEAEKLMRIITTLESQRRNLSNILAPQGHTIQNYVNSLQKANPELAQLNEQFKRGQSLMQNGGLEAKKMSSAITNGSNQSKQSIDELNASVAQGAQRERERREEIQRTGRAAQETANNIIRSMHEQLSAEGSAPITGIQQLRDAITQMRSAYFDMSVSERETPIGRALMEDIKRAEAASVAIQKYNQTLLIGQQNKGFAITNDSTLNSLRESLKQLTDQYNKLTVAELNAGKGDKLIQQFQDTTRAAQLLQKTLSRPINLSAALAGDERTLDDIAYKMQRLRSYRQGIDLTKPNATNEIKQVDEALARLQKDADKWMSKSQEMIKSNTALGRSWNYMKNRLAFYFTVGASTAFAKNLIEVRSQYEMNEKALGILLDSASRGTRIFNELSQMSLVSPYTLIELSNAAKQLTAYDIAAKDVVDTTRRLADMASAVGIPVERLTYALGQIKAYGYLNSRDARMFANAGIPLVKQLADYYSELEGKMVSTADVYDRMKKKAIDYADVMKVVNKMTDEGGKFFDFQAKMADTLKVRLANFTLAWNNMLNDIGKDQQGVLTFGIKGLTLMFRHWRELARVLGTIVTAFGAYRLAVLLAGSASLKSATASSMAWLSTARSIRSAKDAATFFSMAMKSIPFAGWVTAIASLVSWFYIFNESGEDVKTKLDEIKNAFDGVRKESTDLFVDAIKSDNIGAQLTKLRDMLELAQTELGVTIPINLEDVNESNIKDKLREAKRFIDDYINFSQTFSEAAAGTKFNELMNEFGASARSTYTSITESTNTVIDALERLKRTLPMTSEEKRALEELKGGQREDESRIEYLQRLISLYEKLGLIGQKKVTPNISFFSFSSADDNMDELAGKQEQILNRLGIKNKEVFANMLTDVQGYYSSSSIAAYQFEQQVMRVAKKIDINNIPVEQRTMKLAAAINEEASLNNWNQFEKEFARQIANDKFGTNIEISDDSKRVAEEDLKEWQQKIKTWAQNNGITFEVRFQTNDTEAGYAKRMLQEAKDAKEEWEVLRRKQKQGTGSKDETDKAYNSYLEKRKLAAAAGADISSLDKQAAKARKQAESELQKALKEELQLIDKVRSTYKTLTKEGVGHITAVNTATSGFDETVASINKRLGRFGIAPLDLSKFAGIQNPREVMTMLQSQLDKLMKSGSAKPSEIKDLQVKLKDLKVDSITFDQKTITDSLNNELGKLKDEYELAVELDADPELGNAFADMFGIDTSDFPRTIDEYMSRVQQEFDDARKSLYLAAPLNVFTANTEQWYKWGKAVDYSEEQVDNFKKSFDGAVGVAKKWAQDVVKQTQDLQYKLADNNGKIAIEEEKLANLRQQLAQETNDKQKALLELQIQDQQNAIAKLKEEILQLLPTYQRVFGEVAEHSAYMTRKLAKDYKNMLVEGKNRGLNADNTYSVRDPITGQIARISKDRMGKELKNADKELQKTQSTVKKITEAFTKGEDGVVDWVHGVALVGEELGKMGQLVDVVGDIADAFSNPNEYNATAEAIHDIAASMQGVSTAAKGIEQIASGDYIGGAVSVASGLFSAISSWFDNSDKKILQKIKDSEREVKRLENTYKNLEYAIEQAFGANVIGARQAAIANKELQLAELQRQLALEKSRDSKHRDEDRIIELQGMIVDAKNEIKRSYQEIATELLGISSVGDAAVEFMDAYIEALRRGEDAQAAFTGNFKEMIANMIKQLFVTKVIGPQLEELVDNLNERLTARSKNEAKAYEKAVEQKTQIDSMSDNDLVNAYLASQGYNPLERYAKVVSLMATGKFEDFAGSIRKIYEDRVKEAKRDLDKAATPTIEDMDLVAQEGQNLIPLLEGYNDAINELLKKYDLFIDDETSSKLSALQQGIQGITEDTAGALEAYMNGVSQQVYLHSDLLTQIRDAVVGFDLEIQTATQAQMLLQLQQSYQVQMSIQGILEGVLNPSGRAFTVELVS